MKGLEKNMEYKYKKLLMVLLCIALVIPQLISPLSRRVYAATIGKCSASSLFIRTGPGTEYDKVLVDTMEAYLTKDQEVTILGEKNGWYQIQATFAGRSVEGYCLGTYITVVGNSTVSPTQVPKPTEAPTPTKAPEATTVSYKLSVPAKITASELNLRKQATKNGTVVATLKNNTAVTIISGKTNGTEKWYYVSTKVNNKTVKGYVLSDYVACTFKTGFYGKMKSNVTLVTKAGSKTSVTVGGKKITVNKSDIVWLSAEETVAGEKWFRVGITYQGKTVRGYVKSSQLILLGNKVTSTAPTTPSTTPSPTPTPTPVPETSGGTTESKNLSLPAIVNASGVNLRKDSSVSSAKLATMNLNTAVTVLGTKKIGSEIWYHISVKINDKTVTGYVLSNYISFTFKSGFYGVISDSKVTLQKTAGQGGASVTLSNGKAVQLDKGTNVWMSAEKTVGGEKWFLVGITLDGKATRGYVKSSQLTITGKKTTVTVKPTPTPTPTPTVTPTPGDSGSGNGELQIPGIVTANTLNLRERASASSNKLGTLTTNAKVTILNESDVNAETWYQVETELNGKSTIGYVLSTYVKLVLKDTVPAVISSENIRPRTAANSTAAYAKYQNGNIVSLGSGTQITITAEQMVGTVKWFKIKVTVNKETIEGYVLASDINLSKHTTEVMPTPTDTPNPTVAPSVTPEPTITPEPTSIPVPTVTMAPTPTPVSDVFSGIGKIKDASALAVKVDPGYGSSFVADENGNPILLSAGKEISLHGSAYKDTLKWYHISFDHNGIEYYGYVVEKYVEIDEDSIGEGTPSVPGGGSNSTDFETKLNNEGFPESYKVYLRQLHQKYPNWEFTAYHTGLDWNTVIEKQGVAGKNLITNSKGIGWKSLDAGAYNWKTDSFIVYDGSTWVTASRAAIAYYMDPRNFLTESGIFQFEHLAYKPAYQNLAGIENILKNTPLYKTSYTYTDDYGANQTITYGATFMKAAEYSGVSPYHLASRVKQEVVTGTNSLSNSVSGTFAGFEGLFNFYNIGAYHSTVAGGAIANGLKYAKNGSTNATLNTNSLIPWNNRYRSIVGGAYIIGSSYINKGQDTIYLQKFNVTPTSTHSHQYMANVEAPFAESKKVFAAYTDVSSSPIVFSIPVYKNMPATACVAPSNGANPNNWLKTLKLQDNLGNDLGLTPTFDISKDQQYSLIVDSSCEGINVSATTVSSKASVRGTGYVNLQYGENTVIVSVTAENGDVRDYIITVVRAY